jgi:acetyl-CoA carboxylase biotin carboxylase subunit
MIRRVLIANRGEIAVRIVRACRAMGLESVAVYSDADAEAPHVAAADMAIPIGPAPASESYLNAASILAAARRARADAVHPGYGFLSENAAFAAACETAGLIFVGPPAAVIERMGSKTAAREAVGRVGVPIVPGAVPAAQTDADLTSAVARVGFPAMLKATAGGGGRGMRVVRSIDEVAAAVAGARLEAERAFGDGTLYVERRIERARHIEVQILADRHGSVAHLFERNCSLQRRHQKVIEESPAISLTTPVRERITRAAVDAARAVGYVNAGTVEFLVEGDDDSASFYFLEMNTRLQVEHPVTEAVTGIDLVRAQLAIAAGEPLPFRQDDVRQQGHAIECRVYAEDSERLIPQSGRLVRYREPVAPGIRVDSGVREGQQITTFYDAMIAKLIAYGADRTEALSRAASALRTFEILGVRNNIAFLLVLLARPEVQSAEADTRFIDDHLPELASPIPPSLLRAAAAAAAVTSQRAPVLGLRQSSSDMDPWQRLGSIEW